MKLSTSSDTRSDRIRTRRNQQSQQRATRAGQQIKQPVAARPPVTARGTMGTPVIRHAYNRPRRQYAISMGTAGVEMLTPAFPVFKPGWRLLSAVLVVLFACLLILMTNLEQFRVTQPTLIGFERLTAADLEPVLITNGELVFAIDPKEIQTQLQTAFPELTNVMVKVNFPGNLIISVTERSPVIAWQQGDSIQWIDAEGYIFQPRGDIIVPLTVVAENAPPQMQNPETTLEESETVDETSRPAQMDSRLLAAAQTLSEHLGTGAVIVYSEANGLGWSDPRGWKVYVGSTLRNLETKVKVYSTIVDGLIAEGTQPAMINLEFLDAPYYHLEQ